MTNLSTLLKVESQSKISLWRKIGYGLGESGSQFSFAMISSYLIVFYTDVVGLTPVIISFIMLGARIWDAINDPLFGAIAENTNSKWGRFRPYILYGAPALAIFSVLTFLNLDLPLFWKAIWCTFTYVGCGMAYTVVNISIGCLANSITPNNDERVSLNAARGVLGSLTGVIINAVTMPLIFFFGNGSTSEGKGYFWAAVIFAIVSIPCLIICFASNKEIIGGTERHHTVGETLRRLVAAFQCIGINKDAVYLIAAMVLYLTAVFGRLGIMAYYFIYVVKSPVAITSFAVALQIGMVLVNFYAPVLMKKIDKKICGVIACIAQASCCIAFFFIGQNYNPTLLVAMGFIYGLTNFGGLVTYGLCGEIIDDSWLKTGIRFDGVIYSCISFAAKFGNAIGGSLGIIILSAVGFVANTEMSFEVLSKINMVINLFPAMFFLLTIVPFTLIKMTNAKGKENEKIIASSTIKP